MTKQEFIDHLRSSGHFNEAFKSLWIGRIEAEGLTSELVDDLRMAIGDEIAKTYSEMGVEEDTNDPEYKAEHEKFMSELQKIDGELDSGMKNLQDEGNQTFQSAVKQMEDDSAQAIRDSM